MDNGLTRVSIHRVHSLPPRHCGQVVGIAMAGPPNDDNSSWAAVVAASAGPSAQNRMLRAVEHGCLTTIAAAIVGRESVDSASGPASAALRWCGRRVGGLGPGLTS
jgi:hypothetical protein